MGRGIQILGAGVRVATATIAGIVSTAAQTFAGVKTFTSAIIIRTTFQAGGGDVLQTWDCGSGVAGSLKAKNLATSTTHNTPGFESTGTGTDVSFQVTAMATTDTGSEAAIKLVAQTAAGAVLSNRPLWSLYNYDQRVLEVSASGGVKFTTPTVDGTASGPQTADYNCGYNSSAVGDLVYLDSAGTWQKCDANVQAQYQGLLGIALQVKASGAALLVALPGSFVYAAAAFPTFTIGDPVYMSETPGLVTPTQPVTTDAAIRVIGWAVHADKFYFFPSPDYITHI